MNTISEITQLLTDFEYLRERRNRGRFIARLLQKKYPHELDNVPLSRIEEIVKDGISYDREIRDIQQNNEDLRGQDYDDKDKLSQEFQIKKLGKESGYHQSKKQLSTLSLDSIKD